MKTDSTQQGLHRLARDVHELAQEVADRETALAREGKLPAGGAPEAAIAEASRGPRSPVEHLEALRVDRRADPKVLELVGAKVRLGLGVEALSTALASFNAQSTARGGQPLELSQLLALAGERALSALQVGALARRPAHLDASARLVLAAVEQDRMTGVHKIFPDLGARVLREAERRGLGVVTAPELQKILVDLADPAKNPEVSARASALARDARDGHGEVYFQMTGEAKGRGPAAEADAARRANEFIEAMGRQQLSSMRAFLGGSELVLSSLARAAHRDPVAGEVWRTAMASALGQARALGGDERRRVLEGLSSGLEEVAPREDVAPPLARAIAGDNRAIDELAAILERSSATRPGTVSAGARPSVRAIPISLPSTAARFHWSGNFSFAITHRNLQGASSGFMESLRRQALVASRENRPVRLLEVTHGLPRTAIEFIEPRGVRHHGDFLECAHDPADPRSHQPGGWGRLIKFETKRIEGTAVTSRDLLGEYLDGRAPAKIREYFDRDLANDLAPKAAYAGKVTLPAIREGREAAERSGRLSIRSGGDQTDHLRKLANEGKRFDAVVCHELSWTADRINLLEAIQHVLEPGGRAFVSLGWWSPLGGQGDGVQELTHLADVVRLPDGREVDLAEWLAGRFPEAFELARFPGAPTLIVKGTAGPVRLPQLDAEATGETTRMGMPVLRWSEAGLGG